MGMPVRTITEPEHRELLALVETEVRPPGARTQALDDFPLALGLANREGLYVLADSGTIEACLSCLVRPFWTSVGKVSVAAIGSVVTSPAQRFRGRSRRLQEGVLQRLREQDVPLAVLWSDRPEWYAGRNFAAAGLEYHVDLNGWHAGRSSPGGGRIRPFAREDVSQVGRLYRRHAFRTRRRPGDEEQLYGMPGTTGFLGEDSDGAVIAYVFCGKGADFVDYVLEWGGEVTAVRGLLRFVRDGGYAHHLLVPQGAEYLREALGAEGAGWFAQPSGLWSVLDSGQLGDLCTRSGRPGPPAGDPAAATTWLGGVAADGTARPGPIELAVWGFDSI